LSAQFFKEIKTFIQVYIKLIKKKRTDNVFMMLQKISVSVLL